MAATGKRARGAAQRGPNEDEKTGERTGYAEVVKDNHLFEKYYKMQQTVADDEWPVFMETLRTPLPTTFRISGHRNTAAAVKAYVERTFVPHMHGALAPISWYPDGLGWCLQSNRKALRTDPALQVFHAWLVDATGNGDISRQEAVSMVPPLLLDVCAEHWVLDMCAAPGSKTVQLLEAMHAQSAAPTGVVIANDVNQQRAFMLHHQVKRILSPSLLVTNNDAGHFPVLYTVGAAAPVAFDRILCDVPCSGDGTLRKNVKLWADWTVNLGLGLHSVQVRILERALHTVKVGGTVVYSTCSMNPVENEAVVAHVLAKHAGSVHLVPTTSHLPHLIRRPGVSHWSLMTKDGTPVATFADVPDTERRRFAASMFPRAEYTALHLEHCMRILPHHQDTGAFFVAVLCRTAPSSESRPAPKRASRPAALDTDHTETYHCRETKDPTIILKPTHPALANTAAFYGLGTATDAFGFVTRSARTPLRTISLVSPGIRDLIRGDNYSLKIVNGGVRAFELYDTARPERFACPYRVSTEAVDVLLTRMSLRSTAVPRDVLQALLGTEDSVCAEGDWVACEEGGMVLTCGTVAVPVWKGAQGVKAFVPKANRPALLLQLCE